MAETPEQPNSRNIPLPIQREVRKRCGFGCVICGLPLYDYDHILDWAKTKQHNPDEITLLCSQHHREKTNKLLPEDVVRKANAAPWNLRSGVSRPYALHFEGPVCAALIGSNRFWFTPQNTEASFIPIMIDGVPILWFNIQDGHLLLNLVLFDEFNEPVLLIRDNHLVQSVEPWDIQFVGRNLIVREAERRILVDITFDVPKAIRINRGRFLRNGVELLVRPEYCMLTNNGTLISENLGIDCPIGLAIGTPYPAAGVMLVLSGVSRYSRNSKLAEDWVSETFDAGA